ncbi:endo alpha-1,4 polygalactosaminidase [Streptomyces galbus]|uniref:endo alpha-1,4 polygalactosaminidase n=1 Tax=Streptomyces galbus TaxID=33898 RepID=UPI00380DA2CC
MHQPPEAVARHRHPLREDRHHLPRRTPHHGHLPLVRPVIQTKPPSRRGPRHRRRLLRRRLTKANNAAFARLLATRAHSAGLAVGQKNTLDLLSESTKIGFGFAVAEGCGEYDDCGDYVKVHADRVFVIGYSNGGFGQACAGFGARLGKARHHDVVRCRSRCSPLPWTARPCLPDGRSSRRERLPVRRAHRRSSAAALEAGHRHEGPVPRYARPPSRSRCGYQ